MNIEHPTFAVTIVGDVRQQLAGIQYIVLAHYTGLPINKTLAFIKGEYLNEANTKRSAKQLKNLVNKVLAGTRKTVLYVQYYKKGLLVKLPADVTHDRYGRQIRETDTLLHFSGYCITLEKNAEGLYHGKLICEPGHPNEHTPIPIGNGTQYTIIPPEEAITLPLNLQEDDQLHTNNS